MELLFVKIVMVKLIFKEEFKKEKVLIIGAGEVGLSLYKVIKPYYDVYIMDKKKLKLENVKYLHICFPYSKNFVKFVKSYIKFYKPKLSIIHSTIPLKTTQEIGGMIVHSPVRGIHPHLHKGIKTFVKYIGADNKRAGDMAQKHLESSGIKTKVFTPSSVTEIGKLLDTSYYGLCIAFHGEMKKLCEKYGIDFEKTVTDFNKTYNEGYKKLGKLNVIRPVLSPPNGKIGGHCVVPNAKILKKFFKSKAIDLILDYGKE